MLEIRLHVLDKLFLNKLNIEQELDLFELVQLLVVVDINQVVMFVVVHNIDVDIAL